MEWSNQIQPYLNNLPTVAVNAALAYKMLSLIDLTSLNETDTESSIAFFSEQARTTFGSVAAVCVYPPFARLMVDTFAGTPIKVATVANFPEGMATLEAVLIEIARALQDGVQEIDVVFPYMRFLAGERHYAEEFVTACKAACGDHVTLKVILETGALKDLTIIAEAAQTALVGGADFIKTSTGKVYEGATLPAAACMLLIIKKFNEKNSRRVGFKVSGGIREITDAANYMALADQIMGESWISPQTFRIGSSKLVGQLLAANIF